MLKYVVTRRIAIIDSIECFCVVPMHTSIQHHNGVEQIRMTLHKALASGKDTYSWHGVRPVLDDEFEVGFACLPWLSVLNCYCIRAKSGELLVGRTIVEEVCVLELLFVSGAVVEERAEHRADDLGVARQTGI